MHFESDEKVLFNFWKGQHLSNTTPILSFINIIQMKPVVGLTKSIVEIFGPHSSRNSSIAHSTKIFKRKYSEFQWNILLKILLSSIYHSIELLMICSSSFWSSVCTSYSKYLLIYCFQNVSFIMQLLPQ